MYLHLLCVPKSPDTEKGTDKGTGWAPGRSLRTPTLKGSLDPLSVSTAAQRPALLNTYRSKENRPK